jgi:aminopeptidase N
MRSLTVTLVSVLAAAAATASPTPSETPTELPRGIRPLGYTLTITPDTAKLRFNGQVVIDLDVQQPSRTVTLNANGLTIARAQLDGAKGMTLTNRIDAAHETVTLTAPRALSAGHHRLELHYAGPIGTQAAGIFALDYPTDNGKMERAIYTQFESHDARRLLPCFDEPAFRAPFTVDLILPKGRTAVSNLPVERTTVLADGTVRWHFPATPPMSSYLLFVAAGDFERAHAPVGDGHVEAGVVTRRGVIDQAQFALESSREVLKDYEQWFGIRFPLPKLDNIAAPGQSQFFGAMENWGAIFTFESILLTDPKLATMGDRESIFEVAAHEIAHQWFGDLVTMRWWDDLWLNEGFASWMEGRATERLHPEWETAGQAVAGRESAMAIDARATTHPVVQHLTSALNVDEAFDSITYQKGNAVLRMLENYVGADVWQAGIRRYIHDHAYGNTTSDDLWAAVDAVSTTPIGDIARAFVNAPGIPLVHVSRQCSADGQSTVTLTQDEFRVGPNARPKGHWPIPVTYAAVGHPTERLVLKDASATLTMPGCDPVIINAGAGGYYRVDYDAETFAALKTVLPQLTVSDRLVLTADRLALARAGQAPIADVLDLIGATAVDAPSPLWHGVVSAIETIDGLYAAGDAGRAAYRAQARRWLSPLAARLGWDPSASESLQTAELRSAVLGALADFGDPAVLAEARRRHDGAVKDPTLVPAALQRLVDQMVSLGADTATFEQLHAAALAERSPAMRAHLFSTLGNVADPALARRALEIAISDEPPKTTAPQIIRNVSADHPDLAFDFVLSHLDAVRARVDTPAWSRYVPALPAHSVDPAMPNKIREFAAVEFKGLEHRDADQSALALEIRLATRAALLPAVDRWIASQQ